MPVKKSKDTTGTYYKYGNQGAHYYTKQYGVSGAINKAKNQGRAIQWRKHQKK